MDELETMPERLGVLGTRCLVQRSRCVRVQVIHYQRDACRIRITRGDVLQEQGPVLFGSALCDLGQAPAGQRLADQKDVAYPQRSYS